MKQKIQSIIYVFSPIQAFSRGNNRQTIRAKDPSREAEIGRVYAKELSFTDVEIVNRMYKCVSEPNGKFEL